MKWFSTWATWLGQARWIAPHDDSRLQAHRADRRTMFTALFVLGIVSIGLAFLFLRVVQLQVFPPQAVAAMVNSQQGSTVILGRRGSLLDRRGREIAVSDTIGRLYIDPVAIEDPEHFSQKLAAHLDYESSRILSLVEENPDRRFVVVDQQLSRERMERLSSLRHLPGYGVETRQVRRYALGGPAGQLTGFVDIENRGVEGLEKHFDRELTGKPGRITYLRDAARRPLWINRDQYEPPVDGQPVRLSIDSVIQSLASARLKQACEEFGARTGQMIVMDPVTGEVLALANYPPFDPANLANSTPEQRRNRAITDFFEPGSIYKPFIWSAATQMGLARPEEMIDCTTGLWVTAAGRRLHDAHGNGMQTWMGVLIKSSNIGMGKVGERMGAEKMNRAVRAFGFGQLTGSQLQGESPGMVNRLSRWSSYSITSVPMGQEVGVTPLQITRGFCVFANQGLLVTPTLRALDDPAQPSSPQYVGRVLTPQVADLTRQVLRRVVIEGTGKKAESKLYTIWGKTGTAQIADTGRRGYIPGAYIGSFVGGAPVSQPRLVVGCFIQHPQKEKGYYGGIISAPAVKDVLEQSLLYLGVPPDQRPDAANAGSMQLVHVDARE